MYVTAYLDNMKKFEVRCAPAKREGSIQVEIVTFDRVTLTFTAEQLEELIRACREAIPAARAEAARGSGRKDARKGKPQEKQDDFPDF